MKTSFNVRIYTTDVYKGTRTTTYWVRWAVEKKQFKEKFKTSALADSFRSELVIASRKGEAFCVETGSPMSKLREETADKAVMSWFELVAKFVDMKWDDAAPTHRKSIADALAPITEAMIATDRGRPRHKVLRRAIRIHCNKERRNQEHPTDVAAALGWLAQNTRQVSELLDADFLRKVVSAFERKLDGQRAAYDTVRLRRTTFGSILAYGHEMDMLSENPWKEVKIKKHKAVAQEVDRRCVANPIQFRTVLREVAAIGRTGAKLVAFFALMFFAALRPEEASNLRLYNLRLPPKVWNDEAQRWEVHEWGVIDLEGAAPEVGSEWTDSGKRHEERELKHRHKGFGRPVPMCPELALYLYEHIERFGIGPRGLLFVAERGGRVGSSTYGRIWDLARKIAFTAEVAAGPLAKRPYDLRHACVTFWLNLVKEPKRVAEWAGHSLAVLLREYAKCIDGGEQEALRSVQEGLGVSPTAFRTA